MASLRNRINRGRKKKPLDNEDSEAREDSDDSDVDIPVDSSSASEFLGSSSSSGDDDDDDNDTENSDEAFGRNVRTRRSARSQEGSRSAGSQTRKGVKTKASTRQRVQQKNGRKSEGASRKKDDSSASEQESSEENEKDGSDDDYHQTSNEEEEEEDDENYESEESFRPTRQKRKRSSSGSRNKKPKQARRAARRVQLSDSEEEPTFESDESYQASRTNTTRRASRRTRKPEASPPERVNATRGTPSRASAAKAAQNLSKYKDQDSEEDVEEKKIGRTRRKLNDSDEDFDATNDNDSDDDDNSGALSDSYVDESPSIDDIPSRSTKRKKGSGKIENDDNFFDDDDSNDEQESDNNTPHKHKIVQLPGRRESPPKFTRCSSTIDAITQEVLPKKHVCFVSPDGKTRQCFALETLLKIATTSTNKHYRVHLGEERLTFLQPPHFRSSMSEDLLDQIASRFGRQALDLEGDFYRRPAHLEDGNAEENDDDDDYHLNFRAVHDDLEAFEERLNSYVVQVMGSQDIYVCPLCYRVASQNLSRRGRGLAESLDDTAAQEIVLQHDPMSVLGYLDDEEFNVAAAFCFKRISQVKKHLMTAHGVDTSFVDGNGIYMSFKVRAADGLLQRYLSFQKKHRGRLFHGDMMRYWFCGNNQSYCYLLEQMNQAETSRELLNSNDALEEERGEAESFFEEAQNFFSSFSSDAEGLWSSVSGPFSKVEDDEIEAFIDDEEVEPDDEPHHVMLKNQDGHDSGEEEEKLAREVAKHYEDQYGKDEIIESSSASEGGEGSEHVEEVSNSESEDMWVQNMKTKKQEDKKHRVVRDDSDDSFGDGDQPGKSPGQKRRLFFDSDDDE